MVVGDGGWRREAERTGVRALEMAMAWLPPQELAHLARTCQAMAAAVETLTQRRAEDAAQGLERWPVPIRNQQDCCRYPWYRYTPACCRSSSLTHHPWGRESGASKEEDFDAAMRRCQEDVGIFPSSGILGSVGCRCADSCTLAQGKQFDREIQGLNIGCGCGRTSDGKRAYNSAFKLQLLVHDRSTDYCTEENNTGGILRHGEAPNRSESTSNSSAKCSGGDAQSPECKSPGDPSNDPAGYLEEGPPLVLECGGACDCSMDCGFRVTQRGLSVRVTVLRQPIKGWCLHAAQHICRGSFVCEYAGELLTTAKSRERQKFYDVVETGRARCGSALLVLREYMPSGVACLRINIDATRVGNIARFINHACDGGNLLPCLLRSAGSAIPRLVLFARRDISEGEELTYSYGGGGAVAGELQPCYCGTPACYGTLPSENT